MSVQRRRSTPAPSHTSDCEVFSISDDENSSHERTARATSVASERSAHSTSNAQAGTARTTPERGEAGRSAAAVGQAAATQQPFVTDWQSPAIPPTIRRPWQVFEEDLEDRLADAPGHGSEVMGGVRERLASVHAKGAKDGFKRIPEHEQRTYAEVSFSELSAYVCWRREQVARQQHGEVPVDTDLEAAWDLLDGSDKPDWVPEFPRAVLAADPQWAPLLVDRPPICDGGIWKQMREKL